MKAVLTGMFVFAVAAAWGCAQHGDVALLESRLRRQEDRLRELEASLEERTEQLRSVRREAELLRTQMADRGTNPPLPEQTRILAQVRGVTLRGLFTSGLDRDGSPGDEALSVLLVPHDADGDLVKVPGKIFLEVLDLSRPSGEQQIAAWTFDETDRDDHWHSGLFATGYLYELPWPEPPRNSRLTVHARLTTPDGRQFDTSRTIEITPPEPVSLTAGSDRQP